MARLFTATGGHLALSGGVELTWTPTLPTDEGAKLGRRSYAEVAAGPLSRAARLISIAGRTRYASHAAAEAAGISVRRPSFTRSGASPRAASL